MKKVKKIQQIHLNYEKGSDELVVKRINSQGVKQELIRTQSNFGIRITGTELESVPDKPTGEAVPEEEQFVALLVNNSELTDKIKMVRKKTTEKGKANLSKTNRKKKK